MKFSFFFVVVLSIVLIQGKIMVDKWDLQFDKQHVDVKHELKDSTFMSLDAHSMTNAPDVLLDVAVYSKLDGLYNKVIKPDTIHICTIHDHEDPLVKFIHDEIIKFGNITKGCPMTKGGYYYLHGFHIDETKFPMPLPLGEYRLDINASIPEGGNLIHIGSTEIYLKTIKS